MNRRNLILLLAAVLVAAGGAGYYFWKQGQEANITGPEEVAPEEQESRSSLDAFFEKFRPGDKANQANLKEYKDSAGTFSISYPSSWIVRSEKGRVLSGSSLTPPELLNQYSEEERQFIKGLVIAADESEESPENYFKNLVTGAETGQTEARNLTINGYPAYMVKGSISGIHYIIYTVSHNNRIVYFNYRTKEEESAHQNDIGKAIDFTSYVSDFEAAINSIKFSN
ncbi:MAG: PsbP-related protein [Candidatus Colwellbacteria bacterium]